jgi:CheY-like chemotaxis protein
MSSRTEELPKILVVDDDAQMIYLAQYLLAQCGYQSDSAVNLETFKQTYDAGVRAVMLDLIMPDNASEAIIDYLAQHAVKSPIVFVTGMKKEDIEQRRLSTEAKGLKVVAVLNKPFWLEDISKAMAAL